MTMDTAELDTWSGFGEARALSELDGPDRLLCEAARDASRRAYAPYSGFAVGAAVRTRSGGVFQGANVENAAYGVGLCAEQAAIAAANVAGDLDVEAIAIVGLKFTPPVDRSTRVTPCGRCRQVIFEAAQLSRTNIRIFCCSGDLRTIQETTVSTLLPMAFGPANLGIVAGWPKMRMLLERAGEPPPTRKRLVAR